MTIDSTMLDTFKEKLPPMGWMNAIVIGAEEKKSQRGLSMFEIHLEIIEEYNDDPDQYENTMGYRITSVAVYPDEAIQGSKAKATGQAFTIFKDAFGLSDGDITTMDLIEKEVSVNIIYDKGQDGKNRPKIAFGGWRAVN